MLHSILPDSLSLSLPLYKSSASLEKKAKKVFIKETAKFCVVQRKSKEERNTKEGDKKFCGEIESSNVIQEKGNDTQIVTRKTSQTSVR